MTKKILWFILVIFVTFIIACAAQPQSTTVPTTAQQTSAPKYGGVLRVAYHGEVTRSLGYPAQIAAYHHQFQVAPCIETLVHFDKEGKTIPWLASAVKEDANAKTITITLNKGIKFHDGTDFNAEAVKWNLEQCKSAKITGTANIQSIDIVEDFTVRINLSKWDSTIVSSFGDYLGMMISPTACKTNGVDWAVNNPVGTGPFKFVSWKRDVKQVYTKFDGYWQKGKPYLDSIENVPIADAAVREISLKAGEVDIAFMIDATHRASLEKEGLIVNRGRFGCGAVSAVPSSANANSPWANVKVRQAASYAIDREAIVKGIFFGEAEAAQQYAYKGHWSYNPSVVGYPYNLTKAKQLLTEAGYPNGFKTQLTFINATPTDTVFLAIQGFLKNIGIDGELVPLVSAQYQKVYQGGTWDGLCVNVIGVNPDAVQQIVKMFTGTWYTQMFTPDDYLTAIKNAVDAKDFTTKQQWAWETQKLMVDKYALQIFTQANIDGIVTGSYVKDSGFMGAPGIFWTPEAAWRTK